MLLLLLATWIALRRARHEELAYAQLESEIAQRTAGSQADDAETRAAPGPEDEALVASSPRHRARLQQPPDRDRRNIDLALRKVDDPPPCAGCVPA